MGRRVLAEINRASGGGSSAASGALPTVFSDKAEVVSTSDFWIRSASHQSQSSVLYQKFFALADDGVMGGLFDAYASSAGGVTAVGFRVDPSTGAIGAPNRSTFYTHSSSATFSTCHQGAIGRDVINNGHHYSTTYGTSKGVGFACRFDGSGVPSSTAWGHTPENSWPHSNGDLMLAQTALNGTTYFRRSQYNQGSSTYYHNRGTFDGSTVSNDIWSNPSSTTSTNYVNTSVPQSGSTLSCPGIVAHYNSSGYGVLVPCYGTTLAMGTTYTTSTGGGTPSANVENMAFTSDMQGIVMSTGKVLWHYGGKFTVQDGGTLTPIALPEGGGALALIADNTYRLSQWMPMGSDTWVVPMSSYGFAQISIDPATYAISVTRQFYTAMTYGVSTPASSGTGYRLAGPNNEYIVRASVQNARGSVMVIENPFAA